MVGGTWPPHARGNVRERKREIQLHRFPLVASSLSSCSMEVPALPPMPRPRLPTWEEAAMLNSNRCPTTSEERNAQADMLRRMRREEDERLAQAQTARQV